MTTPTDIAQRLRDHALRYGDRTYYEAASEIERLRAELAGNRDDIQFLVRRANGANCCPFSDDDRDTGVSSNAIVRFAYGGSAPKQYEMPVDQSDLNACERAVQLMPAHRRTPEVMQALERARSAIDAARSTP